MKFKLKGKNKKEYVKLLNEIVNQVSYYCDLSANPDHLDWINKKFKAKVTLKKRKK